MKGIIEQLFGETGNENKSDDKEAKLVIKANDIFDLDMQINGLGDFELGLLTSKIMMRLIDKIKIDECRKAAFFTVQETLIDKKILTTKDVLEVIDEIEEKKSGKKDETALNSKTEIISCLEELIKTLEQAVNKKDDDKKE